MTGRRKPRGVECGWLGRFGVTYGKAKWRKVLRTSAVRYGVSALGLSGLPGLWRYITVAIGVGFNVTALVLSAVAGKKLQCWGNTRLVMWCIGWRSVSVVRKHSVKCFMWCVRSEVVIFRTPFASRRNTSRMGQEIKISALRCIEYDKI